MLDPCANLCLLRVPAMPRHLRTHRTAHVLRMQLHGGRLELPRRPSIRHGMSRSAVVPGARRRIGRELSLGRGCELRDARGRFRPDLHIPARSSAPMRQRLVLVRMHLRRPGRRRANVRVSVSGAGISGATHYSPAVALSPTACATGAMGVIAQAIGPLAAFFAWERTWPLRARRARCRSPGRVKEIRQTADR